MYIRLQMERLFARLRTAGRIAGVVTLVVLWLGVMGAASSEQFHQLLHADAHQTSHDCVVTQLAKGQVFLVVLPLIALAVAAPRPKLLPHFQTRVPAETDLRLLPSRGPPWVSLPSL